MSAVNISGTFSKDQRPFNGLEAIVDDLLDETKQRDSYIVIAEIRPHAYKFRADDGVKTPTVRVDHIEVVAEAADIKTMRELLERIYAARTGDSKPASMFDDYGDGEPEE